MTDVDVSEDSVGKDPESSSQTQTQIKCSAPNFISIVNIQLFKKETRLPRQINFFCAKCKTNRIAKMNNAKIAMRKEKAILKAKHTSGLGSDYSYGLP